jgi:hypothetical protein
MDDYMRTSSVIIATALILSGCSRAASSSYGLPVQLGSTTAEVRKILGEPSDIVAMPGHEGMTGMGDEWYDSKGIVGSFDADRLIAIMLLQDATYSAFMPYTGTIVGGVTLSDSKKTILEKLGPPTRIEEEKLPEGTDPDRPAINPQQDRYYWSLKDFTVKVAFLKQPRLIREEGPVIVPRDSVILVLVSK